MGLITLITAAPTQGKTECAMELIGKDKCIAFVPAAANKNKKFAAWPWQWAEQYARGPAAPRQVLTDQVRLVLLPGQFPDVLPWFMNNEWQNWTFLFDDLPQMVDGQVDLRAFKAFIAGIRHRDGSIVVTSQRLQGEIPPFVRTCTDVIYQIGPIYSREEAGILYRLSSGKDRTFNEFYERISNAKRYEKFPVRDIALQNT